LVTVTIQPDSKNWTWVLERPCEECGFDTTAPAREEIGRLIRESAAPWPGLLAHPLLRMRPDPVCWLALEYVCHVRDAFGLGLYRLQRMLDEDDPQFENWDQDETAVTARYDLQDPLAVADEVLAVAAAFADLYDSVEGDQWGRPSLRSDGSAFTVESFGRYFLHDPMHHVVDVRRGFERLEGAA
jgi:hypothetical protein